MKATAWATNLFVDQEPSETDELGEESSIWSVKQLSVVEAWYI